jgi:hypothetical protein
MLQLPQQRCYRLARLGQKLQELSADQARDSQLAFALEAGRIYGLRQQYYDFKLQRGLNREAKQNHTEEAY